MEFNRYTLTGEYDNLFLALLKERCVSDEISIKNDLKTQFIAHINRGALLLFNRLKSFSDIKSI